MMMTTDFDNLETSYENLAALVEAWKAGNRYFTRGSDCDNGYFGRTPKEAIDAAVSDRGTENDKNDARQCAEDRVSPLADDIAMCFTGSLPLTADERAALRALGAALVSATR